MTPRARRATARIGGALLTLPGLLLALGWALASRREQQSAEARQRQVLHSAASAVAAALREGLEELRAREDERPYYLYAYYYTPPDVIAVQESVAVSPLGTPPRDRRIRGHFQLDPDGRVQSPLEHPEAPARSRERAAELHRALDATVLVALRPLARGPQQQLAANDAITNSVQAQSAYSSEVLRDIRSAQSGESAALSRQNLRGRAPARPRVDVPWGSLRSALGSSDTSLGSGSDRDPREHDGDLRESAGDLDEAPATTVIDANTNPIARDAEDAALYTPMHFARAADGALYLFRTVTTAGATSVQGVLLDRDVLRDRWSASVLRRHRVAGVSLSLLGPAERCASGVRVALPAPLDDQAVCAVSSNAALTAVRPTIEWGAIAGTFALLLLAGVARARALRRAEELAVTERAFVASVSHELRTPLTTLRMHAEMLAEGWVSDERKPRVLRQLVDESTRLARLIEDVLTFGRLAEGRAQLVLVEGDVYPLVARLVEREAERLRERGLAVSMASRDEGAGPTVARFDESALEQVLTNLLENAARYGRREGAGDEPSPCVVSVCAGAAGSQTVLLRVRDEGPGIAKGDRERVFERFVRTREAVRSHVAGTGLGLSIVRGLARAMGGDARVRDPEPPGPGCVLEVLLAAAAPRPGAAPSD